MLNKIIIGIFFSLFLTFNACFGQQEYAKTYVDTDYPRISILEKKIFSNEYKNEEVYSRLNRLEMKVFNKIFPSLSLSERTERLESIFDSNISRNQLPESNEKLLLTISSLEQRVFNNIYSNENLIPRLNRLEEELLGASQSGETNQRILLLESLVQNNIPEYSNNLNSFNSDFYSQNSPSFTLSESSFEDNSNYDTSQGTENYGMMDVLQTILMQVLNNYSGQNNTYYQNNNRYSPYDYRTRKYPGNYSYPAFARFYPY
ncbi:MAG: hypothetical protein PHV68_08670, partial [Candidatus Gastranaerophilales bacterium]|nr:hypothetical protein [Candidatus Gastranaerophilales bacterium]